MKLDRNVNDDRRGKYALLKLRSLADFTERGPFGGALVKPIADAIATLEEAGVIDWGLHGTESEFFVIRLKDKNAAEALEGYANEAGKDDPEYADEVRGLADRAGPNSPFCKSPD